MLKLNAKNVDILHGNLLRSIIVYTIPLLLVNLLQSLFSSVDIMVLGFVADTGAVASVGATTSLTSLLVNAFFGISAGAKVVLARLIGEGENERVQKTVSTSMITAVAIGFLTGVAGVILAPTFLRLTNCPAECFDGALLYMRLYIAAAPILMVYNFGTAVLNVSGDSQRPLYYMMLSGALNVVLNFVLCWILPQKVAAVAIATVVSQLVGAVLLVRRMLCMDGPCRLRLRSLQWGWAEFKKIMVNGLPLCLTTSLYPIANLQIQSAINSFGTATIAGNSASASIETLIANVSYTAWASSTVVFVGQNLGARNQKRVKQTLVYMLTIVIVLDLFLDVLASLFSQPLLQLYVYEDTAAVLAGQTRMRYTVYFHVICAINGVLSHMIQAFGYSFFTTASSIVSVLLFRIFWMAAVYPSNPTYDMLCRCFLVSWCLVLAANVIFSLYLYHRKLKKLTVSEK